MNGSVLWKHYGTRTSTAQETFFSPKRQVCQLDIFVKVAGNVLQTVATCQVFVALSVSPSSR